MYLLSCWWWCSCCHFLLLIIIICSCCCFLAYIIIIIIIHFSLNALRLEVLSCFLGIVLKSKCIIIIIIIIIIEVVGCTWIQGTIGLTCMFKGWAMLKLDGE